MYTEPSKEKTSALIQELQKMEKALIELAAVTEALETKLAVALREQETTKLIVDSNVTAVTANPVSQLTFMIGQRTREIEAEVKRLGSITFRLDL